MLEDFLNVEGGGNLGVARSVITSTLGFFMGCFKVDVAFLFNGANEGTSSSSFPLGSLT